MFIEMKTTGKPSYDWSDWSNCYIVQVVYIITQGDRVIKNYDTIVNNMFHTSDQKHLNNHHITEQIRIQQGISIIDFFKEFEKDINNFDVKNIVSYSIFLNIGLLLKECLRNNIKIDFLSKLRYFDISFSPLYNSIKPINLEKCIATYNLPLIELPTSQSKQINISLYHNVILYHSLYTATVPNIIMIIQFTYLKRKFYEQSL